MNVRINTRKYRQKYRQEQKQRIQGMIQSLSTTENDDMFLAEGTKVKLNYEWITSHPDYKKKVKAYQDFVETNKDVVFTVEHDKMGEHKSNSCFVCLKEDTSPIKWLWHTTMDLIVIE